MRRVKWHWSELVMLVTGGSDTHRMLRDRLISLILGTAVIDAVSSVVVWLAERKHAQSQIVHYTDSLFWTTTQLLTVSSNLTAPVTATGRWVDVLMEIWAVTVVAGLTGSLGAFFHRRGMERHPIRPPG